MERNNLYNVDLHKASKENIFYNLVMFPYPSGAGLHVGHAMNYTASDIVARFKRMQGYTVLNPIGWDSFGLPTEGYAMKVGKPASQVTDENVANFVAECELMDRSFDRSREFATSDPEYYKRTQRIFQQLYKAGLVYRKEAFVNRCPSCQTVLANDQVVNGRCERCDTEVIQKKHMQRFIKITDYAERLINDLDTVDRPEETKTQQKYRIGRSEGAEIDFTIHENDIKLTVFTTRPDTIYGVTAIVLAPENESIDSLLSAENKQKLEEYRKATGKKSNLERQQDAEEKSGIFSGIYAVHPLTHERVPVWYADYVLPDYATGAVMFVPAHDERDAAFAAKHSLPVKQVIAPTQPIDEKTLAEKEMLKQMFVHANKHNKKLVVTGGWALDLFVGEVTRPHQDVDLRAPEADMDFWKEFVQSSGWTIRYFTDAHPDYKGFPIGQEGFEGKLVELNCIERLVETNEIKQDDIQVEYADDNLEVVTFEGVSIQIRKMRDLIKYITKRAYLGEPAEGTFTGAGTLIDSGSFTNVTSQQAKKIIPLYLEQQGIGRRKTTFKLRDRSISRQRYWGCPIPFYYDEAGNPQPIPEDELPVILPLDLGNYKPAGKSPLADHPTFPHYIAKDGKTYLRECDTLDTFMDSAFYFLRFVDPKNEKELISKELADKTLPVDFYMGGREHTYGHLLYSRFINKFLYDQGYIPNSEPFQRLFHQGFVLANDGRKMSKRRGNIITPGDLVEKYGKERGMDILRTYVMFMGPVEAEKNWNDSAVDGVKKFLERVERILDNGFIKEEVEVTDNLIEGQPNHSLMYVNKFESFVNKTVKGITEDIEKIKFNTAVSKLMVFVNQVYTRERITKEQFSTFLQLLAPFATRLSQELWQKLGNEGNIHFSKRPVFDPAKIAEDTINFPVQINGKMKGTLEVNAGISQDEMMEKIHADEKLASQIAGKEIAKIIFVQDKIINIIVK